MPVITVSKEAINHNNKVGWGKIFSHKPIRVNPTPDDNNANYCNLVEILDRQGNVVAAVVASKDGNTIANYGTHVVIFTEYGVRIRE